MKKQFSSLIIGLLMISSIQAQIKIGENPEVLNPASVLELESTSRVLVITRMNTVQMESITPLQGAMVYNVDTECVHFFDGTQWINPCDQPDEQTFSADPIVNANPTIVITEDGTNFNFEVGMIRGENIVPTSVNGQLHIQPQSITGDRIAAEAISFDKLGPGTTTGELLQWSGTQWILVDESALTVTEVDGVVGNEVTGPADATLVLSGTGDALNPFLLDVNAGGINTDELANDAVTSLKILDGQVSNQDLATDAVTNDKMANDAVGTNELLDDAVTAAKINVNVAGTGLNQAADGSLEVDNSGITPDWANITNIPADIADGDDDTQLSDAQVATAVNNEFPNLDTDVTDDFSGDFNDLTNVPANLDTDSTDDFDGEWASLNNVPLGFADDIDNDTQLTDAQVATAVNNEFPNLDTDVTDDFDGTWASLTGIPADIADGDDNTQLSDAQVATAVNNQFPNLDTDVTDDFDGTWASLTGIPADIADGDDDTQLSDAQVATAVNNQFPNLDTDVTDDFDGAWASLTGIPADIADGDDDTTLATTNLIQTASTNRSYTLNNGNLSFIGVGNVGVGTSTPNSVLETGGAFAAPILTTGANIALDNTHYTVILGANHSITLPGAGTCQGRIYIIKNTTGLNPAISSYLDSSGAVTTTIQAGVTQLQSDGTNWQQIN